MAKISTTLLSDGHSIPLLGLGTWELRGEECTNVVREAVNLGYTHFDTAHIYENHQAVAKGLEGQRREKLFLTSKIADSQIDFGRSRGCIKEACDLALKELNTDYIDLYLLHSPNRKKPIEKIAEDLSRLMEVGKVRSIGVSNFTKRHLSDWFHAGGEAVVNQVEFHPELFQKELLDYCNEWKTKIISYRSLGKGKLLENEDLCVLAESLGRHPALVLLRWCIERQIPVIPKTTSYQHLKDNLEVFSFSLNAEQMRTLDQLNIDKRYCMNDSIDFDY